MMALNKSFELQIELSQAGTPRAVPLNGTTLQVLPRDASDASDATRPVELPEPFYNFTSYNYTAVLVSTLSLELPILLHTGNSTLHPYLRSSEKLPNESTCTVVHAIPLLKNGGEEWCSRQEPEALRFRGLEDYGIPPAGSHSALLGAPS